MKKLTYEMILSNPELLDEIERAARRERQIAIGNFFTRLFKAPERKEPLRAARPHLAH